MPPAESLSGTGVSRGRPATGPLDRPAVFWALALFFAAIFLHGQVLGYRALDDLSTLSADNGLRLQEVRDLAGGQGWFDMVQHRYLPPEGTRMHWSRLVDAPLAGALLALTPTFRAGLAERIMVTAWPVLLFAVYGLLAALALWRSFGPRAAALGLVVALNLLAFRDLFGTGEIDHHNVQVLLTLVAAMSFAGAARAPTAAILGGVASALSLAVGLETMPFVATIGLVYALAWVADPRQSRPFLLYALALVLASLAAFAAETAPSLWLTPTCDTLSMPWLMLTFGAGGIALLGVAFGSRFATRKSRLLFSVVAGAALAGAFALVFPRCLAGPYGAVPKEVTAAWLELTGEAFSIREALTEHPTLAAIVFGPTLAALVAAWIGAFRMTGEGRRLLFASAALLTLTLLLCLVQIRAIYVGCALIPIAAGWALDRILAEATRHSASIPRALAFLLAGTLFFELPWVSTAALAARLNLVTPAVAHDPETMRACLRELPKLRAIPRGVILGPLDLGAHILFLTDHAIVAAGYHRNVEGIVAGIEAFAGSDADLQKFATRDHADYVALCEPWIDAHPERYGPFAKSLAGGAPAPAWLTPVPTDTTALKLWRVGG